MIPSSPPTRAPGVTDVRAPIVVLAEGRWWVTSAAECRASDLGEVLALIDDAAAGGERPAISGPPANGQSPVGTVEAFPVEAGSRVEPAWCVTGLVTAAGLLVEGPDGGEAVLDRHDLALVDHAAEGRAAPTGPGDERERVARLVTLGILRVPGTDPGPDRLVETAAPAPRVTATGSPDPGGPPGRVPVYAVWHPEVGPLLSLGMLTAAARHHDGGRLNERFEIRRPETAASFLDDLARRDGPAVLLCSDYVWTLAENLAVARRARELNPRLCVIHGGPSSPKYAGDAEAFLDHHGDVAQVLTRGEGEQLIGELLAALAPTLPDHDAAALAGIPGLTFRDPASGGIVRTPDRDRIADLDALVSPYLTGEFDHIPAEDWNTCLSIETNRGCPYGCTFCDWGSSTLSRIRKFDLARVAAEIDWAGARGIHSLNLTDANFGIMSRDVETARHLAATRRATGFPRLISFYPAKNTTRHLTGIVDAIVGAGIGTAASISLQSSDPVTLAAIERSNIATDHYVALAADYRRRGLPLQGDLLLGLPGQTYDSYRRDLQFNLDHEIMARTWQVHTLVNSPMNDPAYRERFAIETEDNLVVATSSFTREDRARMLDLRRADIIFERYGVLRHVLRWLQWDHGVPATDVMHHLLALSERHPDRHPRIAWLLRHFPRFATVPVGWAGLYREVREVLRTDFGVDASSALDTVLELQRFLMPTPGRRFPARLALAHDYLAYYRSATDSLYTTGRAGRPEMALADHPPAEFTVFGDPLRLCVDGMRFAQWGRVEEMEGDFSIGANTAFELDSPLLRLLPHVAASGVAPRYLGSPSAPTVTPAVAATPVALSAKQ